MIDEFGPGDEALLWPPVAHAGDRFRGLVQDSGMTAGPFADGALRVSGDLASGLQALANRLTFDEQNALRVLSVGAGGTATMADMPRVRTLEQVVRRLRGAWLVDLIEADGIVSLYQPILSAATGANFAFEALARGRGDDGQLIPAGRLFEAARDAALMTQLDLAARVAAVRGFAQVRPDSRLFINFQPTTIYNPATCLRRTFELVDELQLDRSRIVFEVVESEEIKDQAHLLDVLQTYRNAGFQVALDDLGSGFSSLNLLHRLRPDYVKLDMELVRGVANEPYKGSITRKLLETARELGIATICEGVEDAADHTWLQQAGADYVQGYLFAKPGALSDFVRNATT
ncbi:EAL domain-containing protein [Roseiterribacter gracilis]|uniref:Signal transduction protein n=1 Tax=Roseiterribacter gracilis TaxID=2812848 RepID=A0A8S8XC65_9PROT|nr:signal transduction protein [Rhodospirillales bacterium TMPK1]